MCCSLRVVSRLAGKYVHHFLVLLVHYTLLTTTTNRCVKLTGGADDCQQRLPTFKQPSQFPQYVVVLRRVNVRSRWVLGCKGCAPEGGGIYGASGAGLVYLRRCGRAGWRAAVPYWRQWALLPDGYLLFKAGGSNPATLAPVLKRCRPGNGWV